MEQPLSKTEMEFEDLAEKQQELADEQLERDAEKFPEFFE